MLTNGWADVAKSLDLPKAAVVHCEPDDAFGHSFLITTFRQRVCGNKFFRILWNDYPEFVSFNYLQLFILTL